VFEDDMRPTTLAIAIVLAVRVLPVAGAEPLAEALHRLQARYEATRTMTADFRQVVESPALAGGIESAGTLAFEKPNRMRWDYKPPDPQLVVGDGETLWIYQPDDHQVIKAPLTEAFRANTPVTFLAGLGRLERDFAASLEEDRPERWVALNHLLEVNRLLGAKDRVAMTNRAGHSPTDESNAQLDAFFEKFLK